MGSSYPTIFRNQKAGKVFNHNVIFYGGERLKKCANLAFSKEMVRTGQTEWNNFKNYSSCLHNQYGPRLEIKHYKTNYVNNHLGTSRLRCLSLIGCAAIGGSKDPHANFTLISGCMQSIKKYLKNFITLNAASDDGIPDINALTKDISEQGIKKIQEAQRILQQKLKKTRSDASKAANDWEKEVLELSIKAIERAINELESAKRSIKKELKAAKKRK